MNVNNEKRIPNFTLAEKESLFNIIRDKYSHILEDKRTNRTSIEEKNMIWKKIESEFNCRSPIVCFRNWEQLKRLYENKKKELRKKLTDNKKEIFLTGGGPPPEFKIDPIDKILISIVNKKSVEGLEVPFDSDSSYEPLAKKSKQNEIEFEFVPPSLESEVQLEDNLDIDIIEKTTIESKSQRKPESESQYKKCPPIGLQIPISNELKPEPSCSKTGNVQNENVCEKTPKSSLKTNRRRPTQGIKALTSSDVAEKYNILLDRRLVLVDKEIERVSQTLNFSREEQQQKIKLLKQQEENLCLEKDERKLKIELLQLEILNKRSFLNNLSI